MSESLANMAPGPNTDLAGASPYYSWKQEKLRVRIFSFPVTMFLTGPGKNTGMGCHSLLQRLPNLGIKPGFPALQADFLPSEPPGKPQ